MTLSNSKALEGDARQSNESRYSSKPWFCINKLTVQSDKTYFNLVNIQFIVSICEDVMTDTQEGDRDESLISTQDCIRNVIEDVGEDDDFTRTSWLSMVEYVNVDGVTGCSRDVKKFLKNGKFEKVVAILKPCTPNALGDLTVTLKDLSGTISDTIHYKLLTEDRAYLSLRQ
ncbi:transposase, MuDR, MULE transposase domain protein [Tanacetum coccineum]